MGLAINGDTVHGLAIGGQAFQTINKNADGSINFNDTKYIDLANLKFKNYLFLSFNTYLNGNAHGLEADVDATQFIGKNVFMCWSQTEGATGDTDYTKASYCTNVFTMSYANTVQTATGDGEAIIYVNTGGSTSVKVLVPSRYDVFQNVYNASGLIIQVE